MKKNKNKVYEELQQQYTEEEIADSFVWAQTRLSHLNHEEIRGFQRETSKR